MKHTDCICVDAGTANCPCPLAEAGECLVCSRLAGKDKCGCSWCGLCIYNEFIQNNKHIMGARTDEEAVVLKKIRYTPDLLVLVLKVTKEMALSATKPGSLVFLNGTADPKFDTPISVMRAVPSKGEIHVAVKIISAKTKAIALVDGHLKVRGIYRNGLLGEGLVEKKGSCKATNLSSGKKRWLVMTKGIGFAPAINILCSAGRETIVDMVIDTEKITEEFIMDQLRLCEIVRDEKVSIRMMPLGEFVLEEHYAKYDKIFILASDHYIELLTAKLRVPRHKLVYANNFRMCCGEGICGACCHVDDKGNVKKMCKCRKS